MEVGMRVGVCALALVAVGCEGPVCGAGTVARNGACEPADPGGDGSALCGRWTHYDSNSGGCEADYPPVVCDPDTTAGVVREDGVTVCYASGSGPECGLPCPSPDPGYVTVCGTFVDVETSERLYDGGGICDPAAPAATGPCAISLRFYDALAFAQYPSTAVPLAPESQFVDRCGNFAAKNVQAPPTGYLMVRTKDLGVSDVYVQSGAVMAVSPGDRVVTPAYVVRRSTDAAWTASAGDPFGGQTFSDVGVDVEIHSTIDATPVAGVSVSGPGAAYYFSDTAPYHRSLVDPSLSATGPNGAALVVSDPLGEHTSTGGLPASCSWSTDLARTIPGVVFVDELEPTCM